jgi:hypothetical protein
VFVCVCVWGRGERGGKGVRLPEFKLGLINQ